MQQYNCWFVFHLVSETKEGIHVLWRLRWSPVVDNAYSLYTADSDVALIKILTINDFNR